ncbi:MAG: HAD-IA family hydrolase, partial [Halanaerobium sp.]|nr:HAD-IA family hydrolase [Halanaerobium sp.]
MQEMMSRKNGYYQEFIQRITEDDLLPGARQLLDELFDFGFKLAVASASKNARKVIDRLGSADLFTVIADGYSVERAKPAPDLFLYAARKLPAAPEECAVIEDAAAGVEAARAAGMLSIGIGPAERVGQAAFFYPSVADIDLSDILGEKVD